MIWTRLPLTALTSSVLIATCMVACFTGDGDDPAATGDETMGDGDGDMSGSGDGDGDMSGSGDGDGDMSGSGDGDGDMSGDGDGDTQTLGPQIVSSVPAAGAQDAGLEPYIFLYFDRVVDSGDASGKLSVSVAGGEGEPIVVQPCPDLDPTCLAGLYPMSLADPDTGTLSPDTDFSVTVAAGFEDTNGEPTNADQVVDFHTFFYEANFYDDSAALPEEVGGLDYDPLSQSLFVTGVHNDQFNGPRVRRIPLPMGNPGAASTVVEFEPTSGGPWTYGTDIYDGTLYVAASYGGEVRAYANLGAGLVNQGVYDLTGLPEPHSDLEEVWSTARAQDGRLFFSWGDFHGGTNGSGIVARAAAQNNWTIFNSGVNLWDTSSDGVMIAIGSVGGTEHLFAHADGVLYKFRVSDASLVAQYEVQEGYSRDLEIDGQGNVWLGTNSGLWAYDVSDNTEAVELISRTGVSCGRLALRGVGPVMHAYCVDYRGEAVIGHLMMMM